MRAYSSAIPLLLVTMLAGCYVSDEPFVTVEDADYPIETGTRFSVFRPAGDDWQAQPGRVIESAGNYYVYVEEPDQKRSTPFLLKRIAENRYVVQMNDTADFARVSEVYYQLIDFDGTTAIQYSSTCPAWTNWVERELIARLEEAAAETRCHFSSFDNLVTVLEEAAVNAAPEAKFVLAPDR